MCQVEERLLKTVKVYFGLIVCIITIALCKLNVCAASQYGFDGNGMQYDPYLISSYEDLCTLRDIVDAGDTLNGIYFRQTKDICFPDGDTWNPIGDLSAELAFYGYYDGNGHTISAIYCEDPYAGLFSLLAGTVRNLGIESGTIRGSYAGSITSHGTGNAQIINCYNKADVIADGRAGGIADNFPGLLMFCINMGNVRGGEYAENIPTAGLISYGNPYIAYCYDAGNGKLVNDSTFWGNIIDSDVFSPENAETIMDDIYKHMWEVYSADGALPDSDKNVPIKRGNTVFMRWVNGTIVFDAEYEPDLFRMEKEKNKEAFLSVYNTCFDYEGSGTKEDPFQIASYEDLCHLRDCVDIGVTYREDYFVQTEDIVCPQGVNWNPIGSVLLGYSFYGSYDGNGHIISNIYSEDSHAGLFSVLNGEVRNLGIESGLFKGGYIGSITSHGKGRIINCYNKAAVCGNYRAGGIADNFGGTILFSWNFGEISGTKENTYLGGIVSYGAGDIEYCHSTAGDSIVNPATFSGTLISSDIIEPVQISDTVKRDYGEYARYDGDKEIDFDQIVFLRPGNSSLVYDPVFVPKQLEDIKKIKLLPEYILLGFAVIIGVAALTAISLWKKGVISFEKESITYPAKGSNDSAIKEPSGGRMADSTRRKKQIQKLFAAVLVCGICAITFQYADYILSDKISVLMLKYWEKGENANTDIVLLGASTMGANIDHGELWQKYGIAGYSLSMSSQTMYDSYHRLVEAEKSHPVSRVVLDVVSIYYTPDFTDYQSKLENVSMLDWSWNKLQYVHAAVLPDARLYYYFGFPVYHDRYHELSKWDYKFTTPNGNDDKGTRWRYYDKVDSLELLNAEDICSYAAIDDKAVYYFKRIIEYCQSNNIELLLIKTPDGRRKLRQPFYNTVELLANEYGIPYIDFNLYDEEINIVPFDFADDRHLNISGARKCADFLGEYLVSHYDLTDHRGDVDYASWDRFAANRENLYLRAITEKDDYFAELIRDEKTVMAVPYRLPESKSEAYLSMQEQLQAVPHFDWDKEDILYGEENAESFTFGDNNVVITKDYGNCRIDLNDGADVINVTQPGMLLIVYDGVNDEIADIALLERDSGYTPKHLYNP